MAEHTEVRVGTKFLRAAQWAADRHVEYAGDVPGIPTVAQVLGLATLVLEDGGSRARGDRGDAARRPRRRRARARSCATSSARRSRASSIADARAPGHDCARVGSRSTSTGGAQRADAALDIAVTEGDPEALRIRAACVLQETRALLRELRRNGTIAFVRCPAPPAEHLGHLHELVTVLVPPPPAHGAHPGAAAAVAADVDRLSELETATLAWRVTHAA